MVRLTSEEAWSFWRNELGDPKYILAPMVNASELQFRLLCKRYGVDVAYTPMLHSRLLSESKDYRQKMHPSANDLPKHFSSEGGDEDGFYDLPKTIAQVCGSDPATVVQGCKMIEDGVIAIDLNCGCPQGIAKRGNYGSFLLERPEIILNVVKAMVEDLKVPITVKIRIVDDIPLAEEIISAEDLKIPGGLASRDESLINSCPRTLELISKLEALGVAGICIHGRTSKNKGHEIRGAEWGVIKEIVRRTKIPIIANGSIRSKADADFCLKYTGAAAVMSAVGLLSDPAMFLTHSHRPKLSSLMIELCYLYKELKVRGGKVYSAPLKGHVFHTLHHILQEHTDLREKLNSARGIDEILKVCQLADDLQADSDSVITSYYYRHLRKNSNQRRDDSAATPPSKKLRLHADEKREESSANDETESETRASFGG